MVNSMIENRELTMDDYLAMVRRRLKVILIPALLAPLAGFLVSYAFPPKYSSQSLVLVEGQKVPDNYVQPVITSDFTQRLATMQQQVLAGDRQAGRSIGAHPGNPCEYDSRTRHHRYLGCRGRFFVVGIFEENQNQETGQWRLRATRVLRQLQFQQPTPGTAD